MNPKLQNAVAIFKALGWESVTPANVLALPLGTAEQQREALAGLKSGGWGEYRLNVNGWKSFVDVDENKLALFAIRIGVNASRAVNMRHGNDDEMLVTIIAKRGAKYAADFIRHAGPLHGSKAVRLVDKLNLEIPQSVEYLENWSVCAAAAMGLMTEIFRSDTNLPGLDVIERRFVEHILVGVALNVLVTGPFGKVLPAGVKRGWLSREKAVELCFSALDAAVRPGDRKAWLGALDELEISDEELCARTQALIPLLSSGDTFVVTRLAPLLIARAEDSLLTETLLAAFSATTRKARQLALKAALSRQRPENAEDIAPWLSMLAGDKDKGIASLAARLMKHWEISAEIAPEEKTALQGLWQKTPDVWKVPPFDPGEVSPDTLTELAAKLVNQPTVIHDVAAERFLAVANAVAYNDPEAARNSLRGLRRREFLLYDAICWVNKEEAGFGQDQIKRGKKDYIKPPLIARDYVVFRHLGKQPCLLSTPSNADLSISLPDLTERLVRYKKAGIDALEADLFLALTRLDVKTKTPKAVEALRKLDVPVVLQSGDKMPVTAGEAVLAYMDDPVKEPPLDMNYQRYLGEMKLTLPDALRGFPNRLGDYLNEAFSVFPFWGDMALREVGWNRFDSHKTGLVLRQIARRAAPLPPGAAVNFLAAQRSHTPGAAEDAMLAVTEVWERGLLRPGVADIALLDWNSGTPSNLAALASALDGIARDGLLSVVWPVLDALMVASLKAPRLLAGTAEIAELIAAFLPEAQFAVTQGLADQSALDLPGIRALARREGSSRAVTAAREVAAQLPPVEAAPMKDAPAELPVMEPPFDEVWPVRTKDALLIDDGVSMTVEWADPAAPTRSFLFTLTLPDIRDRVFQIVNNGWVYPLEDEGQCYAQPAVPGAAFEFKREEWVYLHWDAKRKATVVCDKRNWAGGTDGPLKGVKPPSLPPTAVQLHSLHSPLKGVKSPPLPLSLLTVVIGLLAQDGDAVYFAPRLLEKFIKSGQIDEKIIRKATQTLLQNPVVSPAKLVRGLEKNIKLLHVLWPMLIESVSAAGALVASGESPPVWVNRILDIALRYAPYLAEAAKREMIGAEDAAWPGLSDIAASKAKSTAVEKAKKLLTLLGEKT